MQQLRGGLGTHARHTGNVVGAVAHKALQVDQPFRGKAVLRLKFFRIIQGGRGLSPLGNHQLHLYMAVNKLQAVPVAGDNHAVPADLSAALAHGADHIVSFPALTGINGDIHGAEHLLHHRHLHGQFLRHGVARGLIAVVAQMAEGGAVEVKSHAQGVGLLLMLHLLQNIQKAVNGVGVHAVFCRQQPHPVKGAVNDAVAVKDHQFHSFTPPSGGITALQSSCISGRHWKRPAFP